MAEKLNHEELKKVFEKAKEQAEQNKSVNKPQLKAVEDEALDSVAGGYYDESFHDYEDSFSDDEGTEYTIYSGIDFCSNCKRKQDSRFIECTSADGLTVVICDTCYNRFVLTGEL